MKIIISDEARASIAEKILLLDATVLIDASKAPAVFTPFFAQLRAECLVTTIPATAIEFLRGAKNFKDFLFLKHYLEQVCDGIFVHRDAAPEAGQDLIEPELILSYGNRAKDVSYSDYLLARTLKKYPKTTLLTSNHQDFPTTVFDRGHAVLFHKEAGMTVYGLYTFSAVKYQHALRRLKRGLRQSKQRNKQSSTARY